MKKSAKKLLVSLAALCLCAAMAVPMTMVYASGESGGSGISAGADVKDAGGAAGAEGQTAQDAGSGAADAENAASDAGSGTADAKDTAAGAENGAAEQAGAAARAAGPRKIRSSSKTPAYSYTLRSFLEDTSVYAGTSSVQTARGLSTYERLYFVNTGSTDLWIRVDGTLAHFTCQFGTDGAEKTPGEDPVKVAPGEEQYITFRTKDTSSAAAGTYEDRCTLAVFAADPASGAAPAEERALMLRLTISETSCLPMWKTDTSVRLRFYADTSGTVFYVMKDADEAAPSREEILAQAGVPLTAMSYRDVSAEAAAKDAKKIYMIFRKGGSDSEIRTADLPAYGDVFYNQPTENWVPLRIFKGIEKRTEDLAGYGFCINRTINVNPYDSDFVPFDRIDYTKANMDTGAGRRNGSYSEDTLKKIQCVLYAGYRLSVDSIEYYCATQAAVWKYTDPEQSVESSFQHLFYVEFRGMTTEKIRSDTIALYERLVKYAEENYKYFDPAKYGMTTCLYRNQYGGQNLIMAADVDMPKSLDDTETYRSVTIRKVDRGTGKPLAGAVFDLYVVNADGSRTLLKKGVTTGEDGVLTFDTEDEMFRDYLPEVEASRDLALVETKAPAGHVIGDPQTRLTLKTTKYLDDEGVPTVVYGIYGPDGRSDMTIVNDTRKKKKTAPKTGDAMDDALWAGAAALSGAALLLAARRRKRVR